MSKWTIGYGSTEIGTFELPDNGGFMVRCDNGDGTFTLGKAKQASIPTTLDGPGVLVLEPPTGDGEVHRPEYRKQFELEV